MMTSMHMENTITSEQLEHTMASMHNAQNTIKDLYAKL